jgi:2-hydroxy-6-oxonona-2,4-dienedioate hydrolase
MDTPIEDALRFTRSRVHGWEVCAAHGESAFSTTSIPVVLIHGWGVAGRYLHPLAMQLASELNVHVPDLPGHGRSSKPPRALTLRELADVLRGWMDERGLEQAVLVGQSFGCQIAIELTVRWPSRTAGLVLIGPTIDPAARSLPRQIGRLALAGVWERASLIPIVVDDYRRMGIRRLRGELREMFADAPEHRLGQIRTPSLVIRGARDTIVPDRWAQEAARLLGGAAVVTVPGGAHAVQFSVPERVAEPIRRFVQQIAGVSGRNKAGPGAVRGSDTNPSRACASPLSQLASPRS